MTFLRPFPVFRANGGWSLVAMSHTCSYRVTTPVNEPTDFFVAGFNSESNLLEARPWAWVLNNPVTTCHAFELAGVAPGSRSHGGGPRPGIGGLFSTRWAERAHPLPPSAVCTTAVRSAALSSCMHAEEHQRGLHGADGAPPGSVCRSARREQLAAQACLPRRGRSRHHCHLVQSLHRGCLQHALLDGKRGRCHPGLSGRGHDPAVQVRAGSDWGRQRVTSRPACLAVSW